MQQGKI